MILKNIQKKLSRKEKRESGIIVFGWWIREIKWFVFIWDICGYLWSHVSRWQLWTWRHVTPHWRTKWTSFTSPVTSHQTGPHRISVTKEVVCQNNYWYDKVDLCLPSSYLKISVFWANLNTAGPVFIQISMFVELSFSFIDRNPSTHIEFNMYW